MWILIRVKTQERLVSRYVKEGIQAVVFASLRQVMIILNL